MAAIPARVTPPEVGAIVTGTALVFHHWEVVGSRLKCSHKATDARSRMFLQLWRGGIYIPNGAKFDLLKKAFWMNQKDEDFSMHPKINKPNV